MDSQSLNKFINCNVKITLKNNFWYRAKILSVSDSCVEFIEEKGRRLSVSPDFIVFIEEVRNE